jgi:hypothetical protein
VAEFNYKAPGPVARAFMKSDKFFRGLRGPVGSGKSVACCVEILRRALAQKPSPDGIRRSRWAVVRNTNPQLRTTTIKTWESWFPETDWGRITWHPPPYVHHIRKGTLDLEVIFLALDRPEDVKKLLSLELTGVWLNEAREIPKAIVDACTMRVGRFPSMKDGGPSWYGVIADTNAPDEDHWWPIMAGEAPLPDHISRDEALMLVKPETWDFFVQPGAMRETKGEDGLVLSYEKNPKAENLPNLTPGYYPDIIRGKAKSWIDVYVMNRLGSISEGKPVYPMFAPEVHIARDGLLPTPGVPIVVGLDFGLTPAAVFAQLTRSRWHILHELVAQDMGIVRFTELLRTEMATRFPGASFTVYGDPAGDYRAQTDERTPFQILRSGGIKAYPTNSNDVALRIEAVASALNRLVDGQPGFMVDARCVTLLRGFQGGYAYRRLQVSGSERHEDKPDKNRFSHVHDALQYALLGAGEGRALTRTGLAAKPIDARAPIDLFARRGPARREGRVRFGPL